MVVIKIRGKRKITPIFTLETYRLILKHSNGAIVERKLIKEWIKRTHPKIAEIKREEHLREMCRLGFLKRLNRDTYEITGWHKIGFDKTKTIDNIRIPIDSYGNPFW